jgi:hypothetical protein
MLAVCSSALRREFWQPTRSQGADFAGTCSRLVPAFDLFGAWRSLRRAANCVRFVGGMLSHRALHPTAPALSVCGAPVPRQNGGRAQKCTNRRVLFGLICRKQRARNSTHK